MEAAVLLPKKISRAARACLENIDCVGTPRVGSGVFLTQGALSFNLHIILEEGGKGLDAIKFKEAIEVQLGMRPRSVLPVPPLQPTVPPQIPHLASASEVSEQEAQPPVELAQERQDISMEGARLVELAPHESEESWHGHAKDLLAGEETPAEKEPHARTSVQLGTPAAESESQEPTHMDPGSRQRADDEVPIAHTNAVIEDVEACPPSDAVAPTGKETSREPRLASPAPTVMSGSSPTGAPAEIPPLVPADDWDPASPAVVGSYRADALPVFDPVKDGTEPAIGCQAVRELSLDGATHGLDTSGATTSDITPRIVACLEGGVMAETAVTTANLMLPPTVEVPLSAIAEVGTEVDASHDWALAGDKEEVASDDADSRIAPEVQPPESLKLAPKPEMVTWVRVERCTPVTLAQLQGKGLPTLIVVVDSEKEQIERGVNFTSRLPGLETRHGGIFLLAAFEVELDVD